ncbi:MAG: hypothetical protein V3R96_03875 [Dehalococcoidales bacterium]
MVVKDPDLYYLEQERIKAEIEEKHGKSTEQLYKEREKRARDVTELKVPDRVPLLINTNPTRYIDIQHSALYYDPIGWKKAVRDVHVAFEPDLGNAGLPRSGASFETLGVTNRRYPGWNLPPDYEYQVEEKEFMKEEEYDIFLNDPTDFMLRFFLPRMYSSLAPLSKLPPISFMFNGFEGFTQRLATSEFEEVVKAISKAGNETSEFKTTVGDSYGELAYLGFPPYSELGLSGIGGAPFDRFSSGVRGMKGSMIDMYRNPDKLIRACDMILDAQIARAKPATPENRGKRLGMPLWRGDKSFMSEKQFEKFYWPGLKRAFQANIDLGYVPRPAFEAPFGDRLERLLELPKGKIIASIDAADNDHAREVLKGHTCLIIGGPVHLKLASPNEVADYYKGLFDKHGEGGGLFLRIRLPDEGSMEDIIAMLDSIREYCRY